MTKTLTPTQRSILKLMLEYGNAMFPGGKGSRQYHWWPTPHGVVIKAYQSPQFFLAQRGLIELTDSNAPGYWYRLTLEGRRRANKLEPLS